MVGYTSKGTLRLVVVGIVCMAAISMGASTITTTVDVGAGDSGPLVDDVEERTGPPGDDTEGGNQSVGTGTEDIDDTGGTIDLQRCVEPLDSIPGTILYFAGVFAIIYLIKRRYNTGAAMIGTYALAPVVLTAYFLLTQCAEAGGGGVADTDFQEGNGGGGELIASPEISPIWFLGLFALLVIGAAAVMVRASGTQTVESEDGEDVEPEGADAMDLAQAAGAAADRLEKHNVDVDNEVYRAWLEMTNLLDVPNPDSATPGEFAMAAVEAGLGREHVDELTTLFEEVRYGQRDPAKREERAINVFREIEATYGTDEQADLDSDMTDPTDDDETEGDDGGL